MSAEEAEVPATRVKTDVERINIGRWATDHLQRKWQDTTATISTTDTRSLTGVSGHRGVRYLFSAPVNVPDGALASCSSPRPWHRPRARPRICRLGDSQEETLKEMAPLADVLSSSSLGHDQSSRKCWPTDAG